MGLIHEKYSSPFSLIDNLLAVGQFGAWVEWFIQKHNKDLEEAEEKKLWEFYLHKVFDKSFTDWKKTVNGTSNAKGQTMDEAEKKEIISKSESILKGFCPV